jgi:hypothetical protein
MITKRVEEAQANARRENRSMAATRASEANRTAVTAQASETEESVSPAAIVPLVVTPATERVAMVSPSEIVPMAMEQQSAIAEPAAVAIPAPVIAESSSTTADAEPSAMTAQVEPSQPDGFSLTQRDVEEFRSIIKTLNGWLERVLKPE